MKVVKVTRKGKEEKGVFYFKKYFNVNNSHLHTRSVMILTLDNQFTGNVHSIEISSELTLSDLFVIIAAETEMELENVSLLHNGKYLTKEEESKTLKSLNFVENDLILLQPKQPRQSIKASHLDFIASMEKKFLLSRIKQVNPKAAEQLEKNPEELDRLLAAEAKQRELMKNPNSLEAQKAIEESIRQQNIMHNMEAALEANPESFGHIDMLYLRFQVDGQAIDAFVDTGAQMTIMTLECAERCGLLRLMDQRYEGVAVGVGTGKICGRVHSVPVKLGSQFIPCPFTILENNSGPQVILGLDTLRRVHAVIDMKQDALIVNGEVIPFLKGNEIPKESFGSQKQE